MRKNKITDKKEIIIGIAILGLIIALYFFTFPSKKELNLEKGYVLVPFDWIKDFEKTYTGNYRIFYVKPIKGYPCINCDFAESEEEGKKFINSILAYVTNRISQTELLMRKYNISYIAMPKFEGKILSTFKIYTLFIWGRNKSISLGLFKEVGTAVYFNKTLVFMRLLTNNLGTSNLTKYYEDEKYIIYKLKQ